MPLSDDEQRRLDAIEHALREDPKFVARATAEGMRRRRILLAGAVLLLGAGLVVMGLAATQIQLALGVITCIAGLLTLATRIRHRTTRPTAARVSVDRTHPTADGLAQTQQDVTPPGAR